MQVKSTIIDKYVITLFHIKLFLLLLQECDSLRFCTIYLRKCSLNLKAHRIFPSLALYLFSILVPGSLKVFLWLLSVIFRLQHMAFSCKAAIHAIWNPMHAQSGCAPMQFLHEHIYERPLSANSQIWVVEMFGSALCMWQSINFVSKVKGVYSDLL